MSRSEAEIDAQIDSLSVLRDPLRRSIYRYVTRAGEPVGRDEVAAAVEISRSLSAFHLDKLVAHGLLRASFRRLTGRSGPGAGRPAKLYARSDQQLQVALPAREYELAAHLLLEAVAGRGGGTPERRLRTAAHELGQSTGARDVEEHGAPAGPQAALDRLEPVLEQLGYEPDRDGSTLRLRNCPFHALAQQSMTVVCEMNLALVEGITSGLRAEGVVAELRPQPDACCVVLQTTSAAG